GRFLAVVAANGTHFGSGMHVAPQASLDDGQLDVILAGDMGMWSSLIALAKIYRGTHIDGKKIVLKRARVIEIELERPLPAELDGEVMRVQRLSIRVRPTLLRVINATGVILQTNLGRAPLSSGAIAAIADAAGAVSVEYDLVAGKRGERHGHAGRLIADLAEAEDGCVVNNNAAAVL